MARLPDLEPIQVSLEKEFQPFLGMKKLRPGETPDVIGRSRLFNLEGNNCNNSLALKFVELNFNGLQSVFIVISVEYSCICLKKPLGFKLNFSNFSLFVFGYFNELYSP